MRILQVIGSLAPRYGGPSTACPALCRALVEAGHEVVLYTTDAGTHSRADAPLDRVVHKDGYEIRFFSAWRRPREFKVSTKLFAALKQAVSGFDVVHIYSYYGYWVGAAAQSCWDRGIPYLLHPHGSLDPFLLRRNPLRKRIYARAIGNRCWNRAACLLFNSEGERRLAFGPATGYRESNSPPGFIVPVGIEPEWFEEPDSASYQRLRQILPAPRDHDYIVFFGRIDFKKGLDLLVSAFAEVARRNPRAHLVIAGPAGAGYGKKVRRWLDRENILDRATFTGPLEGWERVALLRQAKMLALLSYSENFGQVVAEAMAARVPVVISDRVNIFPEIEAAQAGIVVPCDSSLAAIAMQTLLDNPIAARQMGEHGRLWAERHWAWPIVAAQMSRVYASIVCGASAIGGRAPAREHAEPSVLAGRASESAKSHAASFAGRERI